MSEYLLLYILFKSFKSINSTTTVILKQKSHCLNINKLKLLKNF